MKRLHAVREAFVNLDLHHAASQDTVNMILAAYITPTFLRCPEGRRTLAYFFQMDSELAKRGLKAMKGQICVGKASMMDAFGMNHHPGLCTIHDRQMSNDRQTSLVNTGDILFKAWQIRTPKTEEHIEGFIQELMQDAIMAQSSQLCINIRKVLNHLHEQRRYQGVGRLLHRLYEPILWCHLKAAHFQVRLNALGILIEAFPIQVGQKSEMHALSAL